MVLRDWQNKALAEITSSTDKVVSINAGVGSGKTLVGLSLIRKHIIDHPGERTIDVFVTPRIRLCRQQMEEFENSFPKDYNTALIEWNCSNDFDRDQPFDDITDHIVIFIVDESLWGIDTAPSKNNTTAVHSRYESRIKALQEWQNEGFHLGNIVYDEAHNYANAFSRGLLF